jgi:hypothetical protein
VAAADARVVAARFPRVLRWLGRLLIACLVCAGTGGIHAAGTHVTSATTLRAKHAELGAKLESNQFHEPLYLDSSDSAGTLRGNLYAQLGHSFADVQSALRDPAHWCDVLILHLNTKYCRAGQQAGSTVLDVNIGRRSDQPIEQSFRVRFTYGIAAATPDYLAVVLNADRGPFGTRGYRILLEAVPLEGGQSFVHLGYSYAYGTAARLALGAYLKTAGSSKVGFTVTGRGDNGEVLYIKGLRGLIERNTMRYYLAIRAYLGALSVPPAAQLEKRLRDWHAAIERYPRQLHEIGLQAYLDMKHSEYRRQQSGL